MGPSDWQAAGATVFARFAQDTDYFGRTEQQWMINVRVRHLDAMVEQLRVANINVSMDSEQYRMDGSPGCTIQKGIQSNYGSRNKMMELCDVSLYSTQVPD